MAYINVQIIDELREILGEDLDPIVMNFLDGLAGQVREIQDCFASGDLERLRPLAHAFKGGAANMGASALADDAAAIERHARAGESELMAPLVAELPARVQATLAAFRAQGFAVGGG